MVLEMNLEKSSNIRINKDEEYISNLLKEKLPQKAHRELDSLPNSTFTFASSAPKKQKSVINKKQFITRKERVKLNLLKLPKTNWKYAELNEMRELWKQYMRNNLNLYPRIPTLQDSNWNNFNVTLGKSEFIGAELTVIRSKIANQVGMCGTVVLETKATFQIVTTKNELKILVKKPSVFLVCLDEIKLTIFGKHMIIRPSERSIKKSKNTLCT